MQFPKEVALVNQPAISPSKQFVLVVVEKKMSDGLYQSFQIYDDKKQLLFEPQENYTSNSVNFFLWDGSNRVWVYSGDLGTFFWQNDGDVTQWRKYSYADSDVPAPDFLKEVRPRWHKK